MAKYKVLEKSYINDRIVDAGEEIEYDGLPSTNLQPIDSDGKKAAKEAEKLAEAERVAAEKLVAEQASA